MHSPRHPPLGTGRKMNDSKGKFGLLMMLEVFFPVKFHSRVSFIYIDINIAELGSKCDT